MKLIKLLIHFQYQFLANDCLMSDNIIVYYNIGGYIHEESTIFAYGIASLNYSNCMW